ncbi:methyltransferase domain-containing protein [Candidatus Bathyarchaeota archaeon]|nr:methyltransferase domain-containing protein [Candidatus Bathyarchaeota archaeon]
MIAWNDDTIWGDHPDSLAPYVPTPQPVVRNMLQIAEISSNDIVYDLGCGDGRIIFTAVEIFNAKKAVGFEINPYMIEGIEKKIIEKGLQDKIFIFRKNFMDVDLSEASVVTLYLTSSGNMKLKPKLEVELKSGSRVISYDFPITGWVEINKELSQPAGGSHKMYLYKIPDSIKNVS